jgi:hypothetical protein
MHCKTVWDASVFQRVCKKQLEQSNKDSLQSLNNWLRHICFSNSL